MSRSLPIALPFAFAALLLAVPAARAAEKKEEPAEREVKQAEVPKPVLDAVARKYPQAKLRKFGEETEEGKKIFEVELTAGKEQVSIDLTPDGKILAEETTMPPSALPAPVKAALQASKYKGWKILKAEKVIHEEKADTLAYELAVRSKKQLFEVVLDPTGKITKEEEKSPGDVD